MGKKASGCEVEINGREQIKYLIQWKVGGVSSQVQCVKTRVPADECHQTTNQDSL